MSKHDSSYIRRCLQLARKGLGTTSPNPMVGAVLVRDGLVIGEGFHIRKGEAHAEVNAIKNSTGDLKGTTLYCSLEPCCHTNKLTPPCTDIIIKNGIKRVVVATLDPNPAVAGKGLSLLSKKGIEVSFGYCIEEAEELNKVFFKSVQSEIPYLHLKVALTLDGRIATNNGDSKWISSEVSRSLVHKMRVHYDAVMVGRNTLNLDNPKLTARVGDKVISSPKRIVVGNSSMFNKSSLLLKEPKDLFIINSSSSKELPVAEENNFTITKGESLLPALKWIKSKGVESILVEGGSKLISSLIEQNLYDEITLFISPKVIGNGPSFFNSSIAKNMSEAISMQGKAKILGNEDITYEVRNNVYRSC